MTNCNLCKQERTLIKKSHIISKLLFRDLFEKLPKVHIIQADIKNWEKRSKNMSDALYDSFLFCRECDGNNIDSEISGMSVYEDYFKKYILSNDYHIDNLSKIEYHIYKGYDFNKLYIFFQIQLFRAAVSKRKEFEMVHIDPIILEQMRKNIYDSSIVLKDNEIALLKLSENSNYKNFIGSFKEVNQNYYIILRGFIVFYLFNEDDYWYNKLNGHTIKQEKTVIPIIPLEIEDNFIKALIGIK